MPTIVAFFVRQLLIIGVQLGIFALLEKYVVPLLNKAIAAIIEKFGVSENDAHDILANEIITTAEALGLTVLLSKAKLPLAIAEKLGFTSKGFKIRSLKAPTAAKIPTTSDTAIAPKVLGLSLGKGIITVTGGLLAWNILTDWVWIGNSLGFLPEDAQNDVQKRALSIKQLIDAPKSIIYSAEKVRRQLSQQERELIKISADEAEKQIKELQEIYIQKFILYSKKDVLRQMQNSTNALNIELQVLRQMAGLIPRQPIQKTITTAKVAEVYDGDTIRLDNGETVRLLGIDSPESTIEAGEKAKKYLKERLENKTVRVESDPGALIDIYGRRLGVVYLIE